MKAGGVAILPLPERHEFGHNLQPDCSVSIWNYTDMADPRFTWGRRFIMLRQDSSIASPQKIGLAATDGWAACARGGHLFIKQFGFDPAGEYPDRGCNLESYCDGNLIELESLGALVTLKPGQAVEYGETWTLLRGIPQPRTEVDVERMALPEVKIMQNPIIV
jgi:hypothetical protein